VHRATATRPPERAVVRLVASLLGFALAAGCAVNPVTGQRELMLLTTEDEIAFGEERYPLQQQASGGLYKVDPAVAEYVASVGARVAAVSDRVLPYEFAVVNDGTPNAWALPGGKIGIHRGLLVELENEAELAAILGHEVVHAAAKHSANQIQRGALAELAGRGVAAAVDDSNRAEAVVGATRAGLRLASLKYGRDDETESDYYGMKYMHAAGYDTTAAVTVQEKFVALSGQGQRRWLDGLFASHPPSVERVANNRAALAEFPPGGELGAASYQARMATLLRDREAYDLADRARQIATQNPTLASRLIDQAIGKQPREALFHSIRGDILAGQGQLADAVLAYDAAIERDPDFFGYHLRRGLSHDTLGQTSRAQDDLTRSNDLMPMPYASFKLAGYALADGRRKEAKRLFEAASRASGNLGAAARDAYVRLDLEEAPWKYVRARIRSDAGHAVVQVANLGDFPVKDIVLRLEMEVDGVTSYRRLRVSRLEPGHYDVRETGLYIGNAELVTVAHVQVLEAAPGW